MILDPALATKAIITVVTSIIATAIKIIYKPTKRISCIVSFYGNLEEGNSKPESKKNVILEFRNSGSKSIIRKDFHKPIVLDFKNGSKVSSYQIKDKNPSNIEVYHRKENNKILILPDLMNKNEYFKVDIILKKHEENSLFIFHRMIDVKFNASKKSDLNYIDFIKIGLSFILFLFIMYWIYSSIGTLDSNSDIFKEFIIALLKSLLMLPIVYSIMNITLPRKKVEHIF